MARFKNLIILEKMKSKRGNKTEIPPDLKDLNRLYDITSRYSFNTILEFGSGFSTVVMALALKKQWVTSKKKKITKPIPKIFAIESSKKWAIKTMKNLKKCNLQKFAKIILTKPKISIYNGQICHFYERLPDCVPDFIYLDGPDPKTVKGKINGLSFSKSDRPVISADFLKYEFCLKKDFFMLIDGRVQNVEFLKCNVKRKYSFKTNIKQNFTICKLIK